jgi:tetratricopeptide (TPR) repeat protein
MRRGARILTLLGLLALARPYPAVADRRDQKAADLYLDAQELIQKKKYKEAREKLLEAIQRASEPCDQQGSETRFLAKPYDPYYWLGVAQMELGLEEQALENLSKSETTVPVGSKVAIVTKKSDWYADLKRRKEMLQKRLEGPAPTAIAAAPTPTAVVVAVVRPTPEPAAAPTATPLAIRIATPAAAPTAGVAEPQDLQELRAVREELAGWLAQPGIGGTLRPVLAPALDALDRFLTTASRAPAAEVKRRVTETRQFMKTSAGPAIMRVCLQAGLEAMSSARWPEVEPYALLARRASPEAPQPEMLLCASQATRYILGGKSDAALLRSARQALSAWQAKAGLKRPLPPILSPAVRDVLTK